MYLEKDYPLLTVIVVALSLMMTVQLFGQVWDYWFPRKLNVSYECDFNMGKHILTKPCEIRSVSYAPTPNN